MCMYASVPLCVCTCIKVCMCIVYLCMSVHVCKHVCVWSQAGAGASHGSQAATMDQPHFSALFSPLALSLKAAEILQYRFCF